MPHHLFAGGDLTAAALALLRSRVCSSQTGIIRKYHIFMCRQCFRAHAEAIGFQKVCRAPLPHRRGSNQPASQPAAAAA
jgi:hypothetical protein